MDTYSLQLEADKQTSLSHNRLLYRCLQLIPNIFTVCNGLLGFGSLVCAANDNFVAAAYCILLGALCDTLDGKCARMLDASNPIGIQLDSLSDLVSFCLAPAFLAYRWYLENVYIWGFVATAFFFIAGLIRLARFNVMHNEQKSFFLGLPSTAAGSLLVMVLLNISRTGLPFYQFRSLTMLVMFLGMLMTSTIRFPRLTVMNGCLFYGAGIGTTIVFGTGLTHCLLGTFASYIGYALLAECLAKLHTKRYSGE